MPYRVRFFNELAKDCDLTVLYERKKSGNRDSKWSNNEMAKYHVKYLDGINIGNESAFSLRILKYILGKYDAIIVGCYNSPVQMFAIIVMKLFHIPYILSTDGEVFLRGKGVKTKIKKFFLAGAEKYLVAGEESAESLKTIAGSKQIIPYYFSSLTKSELKKNAEYIGAREANTILVVGQYFGYKGMDIALQVAKMDSVHKYKFVGMGNRTELFVKGHQVEKGGNIEVIPFLQKEELEREYRSCKMLVLPSRQECWGLVVNEAASFGTPIVSTWGSGAAVEFLSDQFPQYLAIPGDTEALYNCIKELAGTENKEYSRYLVEKSQKYNIEESVKLHRYACGIMED